MDEGLSGRSLGYEDDKEFDGYQDMDYTEGYEEFLSPKDEAFEEWIEEDGQFVNSYVTPTEILRSAFDAGYSQRNQEIREFYQKVMGEVK